MSGTSAERGVRAEQELADFWTAYADAREARLRFVLKHPGACVDAMRAVARLPWRTARLSDSAGGRAIRATLRSPGLLGTPFRWTGAAVLDVPEDPATYLEGSSRQTLRRKIRAARKKGVTWREVHDPAERVALLALANEAETQHRDDTYLVERPDNRDLLDHDLWLAAHDADGEPILLSVIPVDGEWSTLRYFRILGWSPVHSDTRYLATAALVELLAARGVRHLMDLEHPGALPNGLRHFQRMVGFRYVRIRLPRR